MLCFPSWMVAQTFSNFYSFPLTSGPVFHSVHTSIASNPSNTFYVQSTTKEDVNSGMSSIILMKLDAAGNSIWERELGAGQGNYRVLDVVVDQNDDIILTGFLENGDKRLYVAKYDKAGNFVHDILLDIPKTAGFKIIAHSNGEYYVGGYLAENEEAFNMESKPLLISVNNGLTVINWLSTFDMEGYNGAITDLLEIPGGNKLFISGSVGVLNGQFLLAGVVDNATGGFIPGGNLSFNLSADISLGVSIAHDIGTDEIFMLANVVWGEEAYPHIVQFDNVSSSTPTLNGNSFYLTMPDHGVDKYAGLQLHLSKAYTDGLTLYGYKQQNIAIGSSTGLWTIDLDRYSGTSNTNLRTWSPSAAFPSSIWSLGGPTVSMYSQAGFGAPYVYAPDIVTFGLNGVRKVTAVTPDYSVANTKQNTALISFSHDVDLASSACFSSSTVTVSTNDPIDMNVENEVIVPSYSYPTLPSINPSVTISPYCGVSFKPIKSSSWEDPTKSANGNTVLRKLVTFPNPATDLLQLSISMKSTIKDVVVYTTTGKIVIQRQFSSDNNSAKIDVSELTSGIYIVKVMDENQVTYQEKFIKE